MSSKGNSLKIKRPSLDISDDKNIIEENYEGKFFIMSLEFDKNVLDWSHDCTDHKNGIGFFLRLVKWPKIAVKKSQKY